MSFEPERAAGEIPMTTWSSDGQTIPFPVDPGAIATGLGIKVFAAGLDDSVSGMLVKRPARDPEIYLNGGDSKNRQRFTCAHELGHFVKRTSEEDGVGENWEFIDLRNPISGTGLDEDEGRPLRAALVQALRELDQEFGQVFVVSHFDDFMEHCALQVAVDSVDRFSRARINTA